MESLTRLGSPTLCFLMVLFYVLSMGQILHMMFIASRKNTSPLVPITIYESLLVVHLVANAGMALAATENTGRFNLRFGVFNLPIEVLLWLSAIALFIGLALCIAQKRPAMVPELVFLFLSMPPVMGAIGAAWWVVFVLDASFFLFRVFTWLILDSRYHKRAVTHFSVVEAVRLLPEGVVCATGRGRVLFMNDAMRTYLSDLGFSTDLADTRGLWAALQAKAAFGDAPDALLPEGARLRMSDGKICLFAVDQVRLRHEECQRIVASDITEEEQINASIECTNQLLEIAGEELQRSLADVHTVAQNEALLRMKARVHDVIGQRLSILHRFLEDGDDSDESLAKIAPLLTNILEDLAQGENSASAEDYTSIVEAFSLVNLHLNMHGTLPAYKPASSAFLHIIREAATNASKHGQATNLDITISEDASSIKLVIENDGIPSAADYEEHSGLPSMRRAAEEIGGQLCVSSTSPFTLQVSVPQEGNAIESQKKDTSACTEGDTND